MTALSRRRLALAAIGLPLAGCATVEAALSSTKAQDLWGIAKGVGLEALKVASLDPAIALAINAAIGIADAATDAATLIDQAHAVLLAAAPSVSVAPNT